MKNIIKDVKQLIRSLKNKHGNVGYWLDNDYLGGGRHPWEVSPIRK